MKRDMVKTERPIEAPTNGPTAQRVQTRYFTAVRVQIPRDPLTALDRLLQEVKTSPDPERYFYRYTIKAKDGACVIEGPSIRGAMAAARLWGNCLVDCDLVEEQPSSWLLRGLFADLETGFSESRLFRARKDSVHGRYEAERALDMAFQAAQSKAIRNAIVNGLPGGTLEAMVAVAKKTAQGRLDKSGKLEHRRAECLRAFGSLGVSEGQLTAKIGRAIAEWTVEDLTNLAALYRAIEEGASDVANEFGERQLGDDPEPGQITLDDLAKAQARTVEK